MAKGKTFSPRIDELLRAVYRRDRQFGCGGTPPACCNVGIAVNRYSVLRFASFSPSAELIQHSIESVVPVD
jgi:hypothetical protein